MTSACVSSPQPLYIYPRRECKLLIPHIAILLSQQMCWVHRCFFSSLSCHSLPPPSSQAHLITCTSVIKPRPEAPTPSRALCPLLERPHFVLHLRGLSGYHEESVENLFQPLLSYSICFAQPLWLCIIYLLVSLCLSLPSDYEVLKGRDLTDSAVPPAPHPVPGTEQALSNCLPNKARIRLVCECPTASLQKSKFAVWETQEYFFVKNMRYSVVQNILVSKGNTV